MIITGRPPTTISGLSGAFTLGDFLELVGHQIRYTNDYESYATKDFSASGSKVQTTTVGTINAGTTVIPVASVTSFAQSQGISIVGAGTGGIDHLTTIASVSTGNSTITLNVATVTTITTGKTVYHDDTIALNNQVNDTNVKTAYTGVGDFIISSPVATTSPADITTEAIIKFQKAGRTLVGANQVLPWTTIFDSYTPALSTIWVRNASKLGIHLGSSGTNVKNLTMRPHTSVSAMTGGYFIGVGVQSDGYTVYESGFTNKTRDHAIENVYMHSPYSGIAAWQEHQLYIHRTGVLSALNYGLHVNRKVPYGGDDFESFIGASIGGGSLTGAGSCIYVEKSDWNRYGYIHANACKYGFRHNLGTASSDGQQLVQLLVVDQLTTGGYGIYIDGAQTQVLPDIFDMVRIFALNGIGSWYLGVKSVKNILKTGFTSSGGTNTNTGTGNDVSGILIV